MGGISSSRWIELRPLIDRALELGPEARERYLADIEADDAALCRDLRALLAQQEQLAAYTLSSAMDLAAPHFVPDTEEEAELDRARIGQCIGPYRLLDLLGTGGMGAVYLAERSDDGFTHRVALKLVRKTLRSAQARERFERERQILAGLKHPGIAPLFDGGQTSEGQSYYTMEYVDGIALNGYCAKHLPTVAERVRLLIDVGGALAYAHLNLIIHRDIKPSNVLVTADRRVKLVDFGLAKLLDEQKLPTTTQAGMEAMTPAYAAPEQFLGGATTVATDIYQFGVLCFLILSGRLPYREDPHKHLEWARAVTEKDPLPLATAAAMEGAAQLSPPAAQARYRRQLTRDLDAIVHKALAKSPADRYRSMDAMIADFEALLDDRPVVARRAGPAYLLWRFVWRWRYATLSTLLAFVALAAFALVAMRQSALATNEATRANREADRANAVAEFLVDLFKVSDPGINRGERLNANEILERGSARLDSHFADQPEERAQFLGVIGQVYLSLGDRDKAKAALQRSADLFRAAPAPDRYARARTLRLLARADISRLELEDAGRALDEAETLLIDDSPRTLEERARVQLGRTNLAASAGDFERELFEIRKAIDFAERAHASNPVAPSIPPPPEHVPDHRGSYDDAIETLQHARSATASLYKVGDPERLQADAYLGDALLRINQLSEAAAILEPLEASIGNQFGRNSVEYARIMEMLGDLAHRQGVLPLALERLAAASTAYRTVFGESSPAAAWVIVSAGEILMEQREYEKALAQMEDALALRRRAMPEDSVEVAHSYYSVGEALVALHRYGEAKENTGKALATLRGKLPPDHPLIVACLAQSGLIEYAQHGKSAAQPLWDEALARASRTLRSGSPELAKLRAMILDPDALLAGTPR
ncbi:MAG TPA: serine/threonine-protein kinase [Rhodanobacteraceae bacterium]|nr:serine/threonine-protein kinase [Rhodanobacteraceae bacterium]